jgi:hypothetical protein
MKKGLYLSILLTLSLKIYSQVTVTVDTPPNLVNNVLIGSGVLVSAISSQGAANQFASFTAAPGTPIDFDYGIVMSTFGMNSPTCLQQGGGGYFGAGTTGDPDLTATNGGTTTYNAAWIQFDFVPTGDTMKFDYVFMSQEYNVYVNTGFNDVFAFYLTGPNPLGGSYTNQNVALIPGTTLPVTINNVNNGNSGGCATGPCEYCAYFVDNHCGTPPNGLFTGGYTTNLQVVVPVVPCSTYTIKLGVADVADGALNSAVLLKANSFVSNQVTISSATELLGVDTVVAADSLFYEGCTYTNIYFVRGGDLSGTDTVTFSVGGSASMGSDYSAFGTTLIFTPGVDTISIPVQPIEDLTNEPIESVTFTIVDTICGQPQSNTFSIFISDLDPMTINAGNDTLACPGIPFNFDATANGGANIFGIQWTGPANNTWADDSTWQVTQPGYYSVAIYEYCLDTTQYDSVYLAILQPPATSFSDVQACSDEPINIGTPAIPGYNMVWSPGTNLSSTTVSDPVFTGTNGSATPLVFTYSIQLDSAGFQCFSDSVTVTLYNMPVVDIGDSIQQCQGAGIINLNAGNPGLSYLWSNGATSQGILVGYGGTYWVTVTVPGTTCVDGDTVQVIIYPTFNLSLPDDQICINGSTQIGLPSSPGLNYTWSPGTNLNDNSIADPTFSSGSTGTYTYFLSIDSAGYTCSFDTLTVIVNPNPVVNLPDTTVLCESSTVNLDAGIPGAAYVWNTGATTQNIVVNTPGIYGVTVTNPTTCFDSDSTEVVLDSLPHFTINDVTVCEGDSAVLSVNPNEGISFLWSTAQTTPSIFTFTPGIYILAVSNTCGSTTDTAEVFFKPDLKNLLLPNVLTINDDGLNDVYDVAVLNTLDSPYRLDFFDRWGVLLYSTEDINNPWRGTSGAEGGKVAPGTYFVIVHFYNCTGEEINRTQFISVFE